MKTYETLSKTIAFHAATSSVELGNAGERLAIALFRDFGFLAEKITERYSGDVRVIDPETGEILRIEVKIARQSKCKREKWQFCLNKQGFTSCSYSDFCLLIAVFRGGTCCYLVPSSELSELKNIEISNPMKYRGKIAKYRVNTLARIDFHSLSELKNDYA